MLLLLLLPFIYCHLISLKSLTLIHGPDIPRLSQLRFLFSKSASRLLPTIPIHPQSSFFLRSFTFELLRNPFRIHPIKGLMLVFSFTWLLSHDGPIFSDGSSTVYSKHFSNRGYGPGESITSLLLPYLPSNVIMHLVEWVNGKGETKHGFFVPHIKF